MRPILFFILFAFAMGIANQAMSQQMEYPLAVAAGPGGVVYVADRNLPGIWQIENGKAGLYYRGSKKFRTPLNAVRCLAVDSKGVLFAGDTSTREIYRFDEPGKPTPLTNGFIGMPMAIALDSSDNLVVADLERQCLFQVPNKGGTPVEFVKTPAPRGVAVDSKSRIWALANTHQPIVRFGEDKKPEPVLSDMKFEFPHQLVLDEKGNGYLTDSYAKTIWKIPADGKPEKLYSGDPLKNPVGIAIEGSRLLIADPHQRMIYALPVGGATSLEPLVKP